MEKNFFLLIFLSFLSLQADTEFIFSHRLCVENAKVVSEEIYISRAMVEKNLPMQKICRIKNDLRKNEKVIYFLRRNKNKLLTCFQKNVHIVNFYQVDTLKGLYSQTVLKTVPLRFTVEFNNHFAIIKTFK